jgi:hypothetical protein
MPKCRFLVSNKSPWRVGVDLRGRSNVEKAGGRDAADLSMQLPAPNHPVPSRSVIRLSRAYA